MMASVMHMILIRFDVLYFSNRTVCPKRLLDARFIFFFSLSSSSSDRRYYGSSSFFKVGSAKVACFLIELSSLVYCFLRELFSFFLDDPLLSAPFLGLLGGDLGLKSSSDSVLRVV